MEYRWKWDEVKQVFRKDGERIQACMVIATLNEYEIEIERLRKDKEATRHLYHRLSELRKEFRELLKKQIH